MGGVRAGRAEEARSQGGEPAAVGRRGAGAASHAAQPAAAPGAHPWTSQRRAPAQARNPPGRYFSVPSSARSPTDSSTGVVCVWKPVIVLGRPAWQSRSGAGPGGGWVRQCDWCWVRHWEWCWVRQRDWCVSGTRWPSWGGPPVGKAKARQGRAAAGDARPAARAAAPHGGRQAGRRAAQRAASLFQPARPPRVPHPLPPAPQCPPQCPHAQAPAASGPPHPLRAGRAGQGGGRRRGERWGTGLRGAEDRTRLHAPRGRAWRQLGAGCSARAGVRGACRGGAPGLRTCVSPRGCYPAQLPQRAGAAQPLLR